MAKNRRHLKQPSFSARSVRSAGVRAGRRSVLVDDGADEELTVFMLVARGLGRFVDRLAAPSATSRARLISFCYTLTMSLTSFIHASVNFLEISRPERRLMRKRLSISAGRRDSRMSMRLGSSNHLFAVNRRFLLVISVAQFQPAVSAHNRVFHDGSYPPSRHPDSARGSH